MAAFDALWRHDMHNLHNVNGALLTLLSKIGAYHPKGLPPNFFDTLNWQVVIQGLGKSASATPR
jgi:hypothetical protein